ncbi:MAG TPA: MBOAT family O-acyltransferase [Candidatus Paceibacterota bacterium]|nr:MBOAT family O-acyltransferase [Candidatus Paceibacterota bacterium]HRZ55124.1 MBOAT family O-acyltransferase [Candidatus Paceibacterota bacterium]
MLFNSAVFLQFFAAFLLLFYLARNSLVARNVLIVLASYLFYGWWDYRFLSLLILSSLLDYGVARALDRCAHPAHRRLWLALSLATSLGLLGFFKYCNFFIDSAAVLLTQLGLHVEPRTLNIVLPVGISFYTFQTMSYTLDVYRRSMPATRDLLSFLAYVAFFPQLVAGPIERASRLLPQFTQTRVITRQRLIDGVWLMIWGMFKKVVVADNLAPLVEMVFDHPAPAGPMVVLGTVAFAFQIYGDFSGYSDIARGLASVLGFDLMVNFNLPYAATSPRDFWRRWHISLSTWLRDYLYIALGGSRCGVWRTRFNLLATMLLGGLWHGAAWNFVLWGLWHGLGLVLTRPAQSRAPAAGRPRWRLLQWAATMLFVLYGWLLFRAGSLAHILDLTSALACWEWPAWGLSYLINLMAFTLPLALAQVWQARARDLMAPARWPASSRALLQGILLLAIVVFWQKEAAPFIYFQF